MSKTKTPRTDAAEQARKLYVATIADRLTKDWALDSWAKILAEWPPDGFVIARQLETELASVTKENSELRAGLSKVVENLGNGGFAKPESSLEFLTKNVPNEVLLAVRDLRGEISVARQHVESLQRDFEKPREERDEWRTIAGRLIAFARHAQHCDFMNDQMESRVCTCGKEDALRKFAALNNRK